MDRNTFIDNLTGGKLSVATREGGVDRNIIVHKLDRFFRVATREGGVDRNFKN